MRLGSSVIEVVETRDVVILIAPRASVRDRIYGRCVRRYRSLPQNALYGGCGIQIGENGADWGAISVSLWRMRLKEAFSKHVLVTTYEIFEISRGGTEKKGAIEGS